MNNLEKILQWVWLSENEAKIYLAILELGKSWVTNISKKSWIKRTTIYSYINPLLEKDFIKRTIYKKRTLFIAENPKIILQAIEKKKEIFLESIPLLEGIYNKNSPNPHLEFYEWEAQIKDVYRKIAKSWKKTLAFFSPENFDKTIWKDIEEELSILSKKNCTTTKNLLRNDLYWREHLKNKFTSNNSKLLPKDFEIDADIMILWNSIVLVSYEPLQAVVIKNKAFADFLRNLHNYFWKILK